MPRHRRRGRRGRADALIGGRGAGILTEEDEEPEEEEHEEDEEQDEEEEEARAVRSNDTQRLL